MGGRYERDMFRQLQEVMERCDRLEERLASSGEEHARELARIRKEHRDEVARIRGEHAEEVRALNARIGELEGENSLLRGEVERLRSNAGNNSGNSSLPPSTDQRPSKRANEYNGRERTGRRPGGQKGHGGHALTRERVEELVRTGRARREVVDVGRGGRYVVRHVLDLEVGLVAREVRIHEGADGRFDVPARYGAPVTYGDGLKAAVAHLYSEGVMSEARIAAFVNSLTGGALRLSEGSVYNFCRELSEAGGPWLALIEDELLSSRVLYTDATNVTVGGRQEYIRNQSTAGAVLYSPMERKNIEGIRRAGILGRYAGITVNDHETALYHFGTDTAECNAHVIRYNRKNTEETGNPWSAEMTALLCGINDARDAAVAAGRSRFTDVELAAYSERYDAILAAGREQNGRTANRFAKREEASLLNRLEKYKRNHLMFAYDFDVGFTNNDSERDLRKVKNRQKMAGGFRNGSGKEMYCRILSLVETFKRKGTDVMEGIRRVYSGAAAAF